MKTEERGQLKIGQAVYVLCYGKFWWSVGKNNEYGIYKGIVRRKPKCDKSIVLVDFGTINSKIVGTLSIEMADLHRTPAEAVDEELRKICEDERLMKHRSISLGRAFAEAEKLLEQGSLDLSESEEKEEEQEDKPEKE